MKNMPQEKIVGWTEIKLGKEYRFQHKLYPFSIGSGKFAGITAGRYRFTDKQSGTTDTDSVDELETHEYNLWEIDAKTKFDNDFTPSIYCECDEPQKVANFIMGETFHVCTASKGGCGREIGGPPKMQKNNDASTFLSPNICFGLLDAYTDLNNKPQSRLERFQEFTKYASTFFDENNVDHMKFKQFLSENNALNRFVVGNFMIGNELYVDSYWYISTAFTWHNTIEGEHFWDDLSEKWKKNC